MVLLECPQAIDSTGKMIFVEYGWRLIVDDGVREINQKKKLVGQIPQFNCVFKLRKRC